LKGKLTIGNSIIINNFCIDLKDNKKTVHLLPFAMDNCPMEKEYICGLIYSK